MPSFAHILNPVTESESKNLFVAQVATFNSCIKAKQYYHDPGNISLYTVNERSHNDFLPSDFIQLPPLTRNISTVLTSEKLRLPFLNDILNSLYNNSDAEYFVYTNLDIALMPYFFYHGRAVHSAGARCYHYKQAPHQQQVHRRTES